jgi:formate-dependent nitrite reductase cytochrome c552 subunit
MRNDEHAIQKMKISWKKTWQEKQDSLPFIEKGPFEKYRIVLKEQDGKCLKCGIKDWNGKDLKLHLDHIDGNNLNETRENLRYICPNCHSQTKTYCGKNINNGKNKVSDKELLEAIDNTPSTRQALLKVGLAAKGGNYNRVYRLKANR